MTNLLHRHDWSTIMWSRLGTLEQCRSCPECRTNMFDFSKNEVKTIPGNFIAVANGETNIYIVCQNDDEFRNARSMILEHNQHLATNRVIFLHNIDQLRGIRNPAIFLFGTWWENEVIQSTQFANLMNGML